MKEKIKVLIVDDAIVVRILVGNTLSKDPELELVGKAENGKVALEQIASLKPDVVLLDIEMPEMDGHALTKSIKQDPVLGKLPVVLFSSLITAALRHKGEAVGADDQISKPDLPSLTQRVRAIISNKLGL